MKEIISKAIKYLKLTIEHDLSKEKLEEIVDEVIEMLKSLDTNIENQR